MNKLSLFTLLSCCILFLGSCSKESQSIQTTDESNSNLTKAMMSLKTSDARKASFADQLSNEEKISFVENRLNSVILELELDENQIHLINELKPFLKPELYIRGSKLNQDAIEFTIRWGERAIKLFSKEQLAYIFSFKTFDEFKQAATNVNIKSTTRAGVEDCDCSTQSDWCSAGTECGGPACGFQSYACGTLYLWHCDGLCT
ncbi:bacteriocin fulvocin C-related protein [Sphingobacterium multivorum]|uniref:bacteriocin fulvocin C-related protein n=1 Tax=Sphingobacterium multivorum TaxID=28454 RepID=UPI0031BBA656